jgi:hypothetical protein
VGAIERVNAGAVTAQRHEESEPLPGLGFAKGDY